MKTTDKLTALKLLEKGRPASFIATATGLPEGLIVALADGLGAPVMDRAALRTEIDGLELLMRTALPTREPAPLPPTSRPAPKPATSTPPAHAPAPGGTPTNGTIRTELTVDELVRACRRSEYKRTQALGPKLTELADRITAALRDERQAAEAKAKQAEEFTAKKAQVDRLAKQLADARAQLRELKPAGVTEAALDFACGTCGDLFTTSQGRGLHTRRVHGPKPTTTLDADPRNES